MTRGRKPKPTHLRLVTGNAGKRSINKAEPKPKSRAPTPPKELTPEALAEWQRVSGELERCGLLSGIDRAALAAYCQAYGRWITAERALAAMAERDTLSGALLIKTSNGNFIQNPLVGIANKAQSDMVRFAAEFGMTPSARSRVKADEARQQDDPASKYF